MLAKKVSTAMRDTRAGVISPPAGNHKSDDLFPKLGWEKSLFCGEIAGGRTRRRTRGDTESAPDGRRAATTFRCASVDGQAALLDRCSFLSRLACPARSRHS
jgi:hypothetical protein